MVLYPPEPFRDSEGHLPCCSLTFFSTSTAVSSLGETSFSLIPNTEKKHNFLSIGNSLSGEAAYLLLSSGRETGHTAGLLARGILDLFWVLFSYFKKFYKLNYSIMCQKYLCVIIFFIDKVNF